MTRIAIVIVNYNLRDAMLECLASLVALAKKEIECEIIVVDNDSSDGSVAQIAQKFPSVTILENKQNLGYTGGNNVGIKYALDHQAQYILIVNPDIIADQALATELINGFSDSNVGVTVPKIYFAKGYEFHKDRYSEQEMGKVIWYAGGIMDWSNIIGHHRGVDEVDHGQYDQPIETEYASGNCLMIKRTVLETVGLFDERYFLYYEDADFSMRVKKAGYIIKYCPKAYLWHKNAQAAGGSGSALQDYFISRNRLLFGFSYASARTKFALFRESIRNLFSYSTRRLASLDYYMGKFGKGSYLKDKR